MKKLIIALVSLIVIGATAFAYQFKANVGKYNYCPLCGKQVEITKIVEEGDTTMYYYKCTDCGSVYSGVEEISTEDSETLAKSVDSE